MISETLNDFNNELEMFIAFNLIILLSHFT